MGNLEKCFNCMQALIIVAIWAYFFFSGIFNLNKMILNRNEFFLSKEQCDAKLLEYTANDFQFRQNAIDEYMFITETKKQELSWNLIANHVDILNQLNGDFSCYCDFKKGKYNLD